MGGMRRKPTPRVAQEGGPVRPGVKGKGNTTIFFVQVLDVGCGIGGPA